MKLKRSNWKVPFIQPVWFGNNYKSKKLIKIFKRNSIISHLLINRNVSIYNGKVFNKIQISKDMIRHKYGEFSLTKVIGYKSKKQKKTGRRFVKR